MVETYLHNNALHWKEKPSMLEGYYQNYTLETEKGDTIQVDFHMQRRMVRINLELAGEPGCEYVTTLKSGTIIQERESRTRRTLDLTSRINPLEKYFSSLPNADILQAIGSNFNFPYESRKKSSSFNVPRNFVKSRFSFNILENIQENLEKRRYTEGLPASTIERFLRRLPSEFFDLCIGGIAFWLGSLG